MKSLKNFLQWTRLLERPWLLLVLISMILRLVAALRPLAMIDAVPLPDDAYISLGLARSIAGGLGPLFGGGLTNGFQPLYVFLIVPVFWIFPGHFVIPVHAALLLLAVFDTLALLLLLRLLERLGNSAWALSLVAASWAFSFYRLQMAVNGLETVIAFFFIIAAFSYYVKIGAEAGSLPGPGRLFRLGVLLGLAALARIDNLILALVLAAALALRQLRQRLPWALQWKNLAWLAAGGALAYLPWLAYSFAYTRQVFPLSGNAVRLISTGNLRHRPPFVGEALAEIFNNNLPLIACAAALLAFRLLLPAGLPRRELLRRLRGRLQRYGPLLWFCLLLTAAYAFYAYGYWAFFRYLYPVSLVFLPLLAEAWDGCIPSLRAPWAKGLLFALLLALLIVGGSRDPRARDLLLAKASRHSGYMDLGLWARRNLPDGTLVGSGQSGALGYFATNLRVVNLDGVVNEGSYRALKEKQFTRYARGIGLQYILGWDSEIRFFKRFSSGYREGELVRVRRIGDFHFWDQRRWSLFRVGGAPAPAAGRKAGER